MNGIFDIIKGIHPGKYIGRELEKRHFNQRQFALVLNEHPQTLNAIIKGSRNLNLKLALKIEKHLDLEEGFLMHLQVCFDIKKLKTDFNYHPDLSKFNRTTFWDTSIENIDWKRMKKAVISRIFSYGSSEEQQEIERFYGKKEVEEIILSLQK